MQLTNFLQLITDLDNQITFFYQIDGQTFPLSKLTLTSSACLATSSQTPLTKERIAKIVKNMHHRNLPLLVASPQTKSVPVYGLHIDLQAHTATLM